jgi:phage baseplate assembly protein gpV
MITSQGLIELGFTRDDFRLQDNSDGAGVFIADWNSGSPQPSVAEIEAAHTTWQTAYDAQAYARNRKAEYPSIGDQLDMIYHNGDGGDTFQAAIKAVKDKYPKP